MRKISAQTFITNGLMARQMQRQRIFMHRSSNRSDTPRLDAELLLQEVVHKDRLALHLARHEPISDEGLRQYFALVKRRLSHEPLAYIIGHREFYGHDFLVEPACLIPRPDTEIVVEECLNRIDHDSESTILDLCTGSGAIALALLKERPYLTAIATDIARNTLSVAAKNAQRLNVSERLKLYEGDLFRALPASTKVALIVSNPPYIPSDDIALLDSSVRDYEPRGALDGDKDGLTFYRRIITEAPAYLVPQGWLICEIGFNQAEDICAMTDDRWFPPKFVARFRPARSRYRVAITIE